MSKNRLWRRQASGRAILALLALTVGQCAHAATISVNTATDEFGENLFACGLREAIQASNTHAAFGGCAAGDVAANSIILQPGIYTLSRVGSREDLNSTGDLDVTSNITFVAGGGLGQVTINGKQDRLFHIRNATVTFFSMILANGDPHFGRPANENQNGGAVAIDNSIVDFNDCVLRDNQATFGGAVQSFSGSQVTFSRSSLVHNYSSQEGGAVVLGINALSMKFLSSTISGNKAGSGGGGIDVVDGTLTLNNATIAYNEANYQNAAPTDGGGGIVVNGGTVSVTNSIIADNRAHAFLRPDCDGGLATFDYSLISDSAGCSFLGTTVSSLLNVEPGLAPLFDYGAHNPAHHPRYFSPAINSASFAATGSTGACESMDQRGTSGQGRCDMGAIQWDMDFVVDRNDDAIDDNPGDGVCHAPAGGCTLRAAIMEANATPGLNPFRSILLPAHTLDLSIAGRNENQAAAGDLDILRQVNIFGPVAGGNVLVLGRAAVNANQIDRAFDIVATSALVDFDVSNGNADSNGAGMSVQIPGNVLFYGGALRGNSAVGYGGGLYLNQGIFTGEHCFIGNNTAGNGGGGIFEDFDALDSYPLNLHDCTVGGNRTQGAGGGIYVADSQAYLNFVTVAFNRANTDHDNIGDSGGIKNSSGTVTLTNTLISNNSVGANGLATDVPNDCSGNAFGQSGQNLVQTQGGCTFNGPMPIAADPLLVTNRNYDYFPLIPSSLAYHTVPQDKCRDLFGILELTDQRGFPRPAGGLLPTPCSIGAYEGFEDSIFANGFEQAPL